MNPADGFQGDFSGALGRRRQPANRPGDAHPGRYDLATGTTVPLKPGQLQRERPHHEGAAPHRVGSGGDTAGNPSVDTIVTAANAAQPVFDIQASVPAIPRGEHRVTAGQGRLGRRFSVSVSGGQLPPVLERM